MKRKCRECGKIFQYNPKTRRAICQSCINKKVMDWKKRHGLVQEKDDELDKKAIVYNKEHKWDIDKVLFASAMMRIRQGYRSSVQI